MEQAKFAVHAGFFGMDDDAFVGDFYTFYIGKKLLASLFDEGFFEGVPRESYCHISVTIVVLGISLMFLEIEAFHYVRTILMTSRPTV